MALDFLSGGSSGLGGLTSFASGIGGLLNAFGFGKPKINYGPTPSEKQANSLFQALLDPNNSLVKQNTDINMQKGMQDFLMQLKQMQMLDARRGARGMRGTFFNPERADEVVNYLTTRGMPAIADKARTRAVDDIRSTASSLAGFAPVEQARINQKNQNRGVDYQNFQMQGGFGGMANQFGGGLQDLLRSLFGGQQSRPNQSFVGPMPYQSGIF